MRTEQNDCTCNYCKTHICILNGNATKCLDPRCEHNKPSWKKRYEK